MPRYVLEREIIDSPGRWRFICEFNAANIDEAERIAINEHTTKLNRAMYGNVPIRILEVAFLGLPEDTGYLREPTEEEQRLMDIITRGEMNAWLYGGGIEEDFGAEKQ